MLNPTKVFIAENKIKSGFPPKPVDLLWFHGRSFDDFTGLFELSSEMYHRKWVNLIALFNNEGERYGSDTPFESNPGRTWCREQLVSRGVDDFAIVTQPHIGGKNTLEESREFLALSREFGLRSAVILTQPHQLLRAMSGAVRVMQKKIIGWSFILLRQITLPGLKW